MTPPLRALFVLDHANSSCDFSAPQAQKLMTLVLQTAADTKSETRAAIAHVLSSRGFSQQETSVSAGADTFHYYSSKDRQDAKPVIEALMKLPGVVAAYVKPEGVPPI